MMNHNSENTNAFIIHIAAFGEFFLSFWGIVTPLILWQTLKNRSAFLDQQGREAVNFNISYSLYMFVASMIVGPFFIRSVFFNRNLSDSYWNFDWLDFDFSLGWDIRLSWVDISSWIYWTYQTNLSHFSSIKSQQRRKLHISAYH